MVALPPHLTAASSACLAHSTSDSEALSTMGSPSSLPYSCVTRELPMMREAPAQPKGPHLHAARAAGRRAAIERGWVRVRGTVVCRGVAGGAAGLRSDGGSYAARIFTTPFAKCEILLPRHDSREASLQPRRQSPPSPHQGQPPAGAIWVEADATRQCQPTPAHHYPACRRCGGAIPGKGPAWHPIHPLTFRPAPQRPGPPPARAPANR